MAKLAKRKSRLSVEFSDTVRERGKLREVIMDFTPFVVSVRLKGLRTSYPITAASIFNRAVMIATEKKRAEKAKKGKGR
jgi:hypothetical protein